MARQGKARQGKARQGKARQGKLCSVLVLLFLCVALAPANLWVFVTQVDFTGNFPATNRYWYYSNPDGSPQSPPVGGGQYPSLEQNYVPGAVMTDRIVYRRGSTVTLRRRFTNKNPSSITGTLTMENARLEVPAYFDRPAQTIYLTNAAPTFVSIPGSGGTVDVTVTITGVPNYVALGWLNYGSHLFAISGAPAGLDLIQDPIGSTGTETYRLYLTDEAPVEHQTVPWTDVLEKSCNYGYGKAGPTDVSHDVTFGLYWAYDFAYNLGDPDVSAVWVNWPDPDSSDLGVTFGLRKLLNHMYDEGIQPGNCSDVSTFLLTLQSSLGISGDLQQLFRSGSDPPAPFITNKVVPIGSNGADTGLYVHIFFTMHQQFIRSSSLVHDAALAYRWDLGGQTYMNPAANWAMPGYWQTMIGNLSYGLVYRDVVSGDTEQSHPPYPFLVALPDPTVPARPTAMAGPVVFDIDGYDYYFPPG